MDGFSYINIFDTKGIEYIAVIIFFLLLIPFWIILNKKVNIGHQISRIIGNLTPNSLKIPQGVFFSKNHTWTHLSKSGDASIGIDDFLMHLTGTVKLKLIRKPGETILHGELLTEIDQDNKTLKIFSPISGTILKVNGMIPENPSLASQDPFGKGWMYKIKPSNWIAETRSLYLAEEATHWSTGEINRFKDFLTLRSEKFNDNQAFQVLMDGGELCDNLLSEMPKEIWKDFQGEFLDYPTWEDSIEAS
jgi:glycine cleavage system H protein